MNASKHGLTGIAVLMRPEEREARDIFIAAFLRRLAPDGPIETEYSEAIAEQTWRLKRARSLDQNTSPSHPALYNKPGVHDHPEIDRAVAHAKGFVENSAEFQRLTTYERRLELSVRETPPRLRNCRPSARPIAPKPSSSLPNSRVSIMLKAYPTIRRKTSRPKMGLFFQTLKSTWPSAWPTAENTQNSSKTTAGT